MFSLYIYLHKMELYIAM